MIDTLTRDATDHTCGGCFSDLLDCICDDLREWADRGCRHSGNCDC